MLPVVLAQGQTDVVPPAAIRGGLRAAGRPPSCLNRKLLERHCAGTGLFKDA